MNKTQLTERYLDLCNQSLTKELIFQNGVIRDIKRDNYPNNREHLTLLMERRQEIEDSWV